MRALGPLLPFLLLPISSGCSEKIYIPEPGDTRPAAPPLDSDSQGNSGSSQTPIKVK